MVDILKYFFENALTKKIYISIYSFVVVVVIIRYNTLKLVRIVMKNLLMLSILGFTKISTFYSMFHDIFC